MSTILYFILCLQADIGTKESSWEFKLEKDFPSFLQIYPLSWMVVLHRRA